MLTSRGVTAWRHALASVAPAAMPARPATSPSPPASPQAAAMPALPAQLAAELIHALAGLAIGGPLTRSGLPPP
ncbi:MAG TPA: hypothetical protein VMK84_15525 [Streptosporangiaceae bacterium]|nr:hypothetical protein [Streptosporangiaceae bacterium]